VAEAGLAQELLRLGLTLDDRVIGLDLEDLEVEGAITSHRRRRRGVRPVPGDRGTQGAKRSLAADGDETPMHPVRARRDQILTCDVGLR
jgi:hypothetical protein